MSTHKPSTLLRTLILLSVILSNLALPVSPVAAAPSANALQFNGTTSQYVGFGTTGRDYLGSATFTLELWFRRTAVGATVSTGTGGVTAVPLLTKGMGEADASNKDCNYFLGIRGSDSVLVADFEDSTNGLNHPIAGVTVLPAAENVWHHAAATYDGTKWQLFLDGKLEAELNVGKTPQADSIQYAALGTAMPSTGQTPNGAFAGVLDEARIWNYARTQAEILSTMNVEIASPDPSKLLGYWKMNDGTGSVVADSSGRATPVPGTITGATWAPNNGFPINLDTTVPGTPAGLSATGGDAMVTLAWTAPADTDVMGYNVYRGTSSSVSLSNPINGNNLVSGTAYVDGGLTNETPYYYAVTAVDSSDNASAGSTESNATPQLVPTHYALRFNGISQYVTFGTARRVGVETFTIETWFKRLGNGVTVDTGGVVAEPLVTKGRGEADGSNVDMNYFLGIRQTDGFLVADFEDGATGANHPIIGTSSVADGQWHHAALSYDTANPANLRLYLDGTQQGAVTITKLQPRSDSIQHAALATAMNSSGTASGYFNGILDEGRIWDYARTQTEISSNKNNEIMTDPHLLARWGLNEGSSTAVTDTSGRGIHGTAVGSPTWVTGYLQPPDMVPPAAPTGLTATAGGEIVILSWNANIEPDLAGYNLYRSTSSGGPYTKLNSSLLTGLSYTDSGLTNDTAYYYKVTAVDTSNNDSGAPDEVTATPQDQATGLQFDGTNDYVTFGAVSGLGATNFTLETWFYWTGGGVAMTTSGTQGLPSVIPLISKGRGESDNNDNKDMNYFLGIDMATKALAVDFEDMATGMNYPFVGTTPVTINTWQHAAVTYDSVNAIYNLYLNGEPAGSSDIGSNILPRSDSVQHAGLATAMNSSGVAAGYFQGSMDEARIWNVARTQADIQSTINSQLTGGTGLLARWGLNEGYGTTCFSSVGTFPGPLTNGALWVPGAPFDIVFDTTPPAAPTDLTASGASTMVTLDWADNTESDLAGYNVYRGTVSGTHAKVNTALVAHSTYVDTGLTNLQEYFYVVRAVDTSGNESSDSNEAYAIPMEDLGSALAFTDSNAYVTFGDPAKLDLATFTIETWFKRTDAGTPSTTGSGGIPNAIPLVTHGAPQDEGGTIDANWVLVINDASDVIAADFEDMATGANHPVSGVTPITNDVWHHAAATWDGTSWRLYLDGKLEASLAVAAVPRSDTTQHAALGTMLTTSGGPNGYFEGVLDEARVWNRALTPAEILATINEQITSGDGLAARWGLNEGSGTLVHDSISPLADGTITGSGYAWVPGAPFNLNVTPGTPTLVAPADLASGVSTSTPLTVHVTDPTNSELTVAFYGRPNVSPPGDDFTLIAIPDPQYYAASYPDIYNGQMTWVVNNKTTRNIAYVASLGDNVDDASNTTQWGSATSAWDLLTTGGVPYGLALGNHDGAPAGTGNFNTSFGFRLYNQATYGGRYGMTDYDNTYATFSASGMDFIVLFIEYDTSMTSPTHPVLLWANGVLGDNPGRRAIVVTHNLLNSDSGATFTSQGSAIYEALKGNANLFLMMGGHLDGSKQRTDVYNGQVVNSLRSDYQFVDGQQSGYLRIMRFSPIDNKIYVTTYSPNQNKYLTDSTNQFSLDYAMSSSAPFTLIGTAANVLADSDATVNWSGLNNATEYEWYAVSSNSAASTASPVWSFTTEATSNHAPVITESDPAAVTMSEDGSPTAFSLTLNATDADTGDTLTWSISTPASHGTASASGAGASVVVGYTPTLNYNGNDSFVVQVSDDNGGVDTITVNVTILAVNDAPVCSNTTLTTSEDTTGEASPACIDVDTGDTLTYSIVAQPTHGAATVVAGMLQYTPIANTNGEDSFTYRANDGTADSNTAAVSVTVTPVNDPPTVTNPGSQTNAEGDTVSLLIVATDVDDPALTYSAIGLPTGLMVNATTGEIHGQITYHAAKTYNVTVTVTDGTTPILQSFTWTVAQAASGLCENDSSLVGCWPMEEGSGGTIWDASSGGNDGTLQGTSPFTWVTGRDGTYALKLNPASPTPITDQYSRAPDDPSLNITDKITLTAWVKPEKYATQYLVKKVSGSAGYELSLSTTKTPDDGSSQRVFVRFNGSNTYRLNSTSFYPIDGNTWIHVAATYDNTTVPPTMSLYVNGVLDVSGAGPTSIAANTAFLGIGAQGDGTSKFQGAMDDVRIYNRALTLEEIQGLAGVNRAPVLTAIGNKTTDELALLTFTATASDLDAPSQTLTFSLVDAPTGAAIDGGTGVFIWTPTEAQGPNSYPFTVKVCDSGTQVKCDEETITVTVSEVNVAPVLGTIGPKSVDEQRLLTFTATATDVDIPANTLTFGLAAGAPDGAAIDPNSGVFTWTPTHSQVGVHSVTVQVFDGSATDSETIQITVEPLPAITALTLKQSTDETSWSAVFGDLAAGYRMALDPALEYEYLDVAALTANKTLKDGLHPFTLNTLTLPAGFYPYWAAKGVDADATSGTWQAVMWQIITGNQPMFYLKVDGANYMLVDGLQYLAGAGEQHLRISGDYPLGAYSFDGAITDQIGGTAPVAANITFEALPAITALTLEQSTDQASWSAVAGDLATGYTLPLDLTAAYHYLDVATLTANKTLADGLHPFTLNTTSLPAGFYAYWDVKGVDAEATPGAWQAVMWQIINGNQPMFYLKVDGANYMLVDGLQSLAGAGEQHLRISADYPLGAYSFDGVITDEIGESSPLTAHIAFTRLNHAPVALADSYTTAEDTALIVAAPGVLVNDTDVEGDALSALLVTGVAHGTLVLNPDGSFTYTPAAGYYGPDSFTYKANDGTLQSEAATVSLTVGPVNDPPVATNDSYDVLEDGTLIQDAPGVLANDSDPENSPLTAVKVTDPQHGSLTLNANGSFTYVPAANFNGADSFTYKASDGTLQSEAATVSLTVTAVNDAPVLDAIGNQVIDEQTLLTFTATATDVDIPANSLTFSLAAGAPDGAAIDGSTGAFTWTPTEAQVGDHTFTVKVCDNGTPELCDQEEITITVEPLPAITALTLKQSTDQASWSVVFGDLGTGYRLALDPALEYEYLDVAALTANKTLKDGLHPFTLDETKVPAGFYDYWNAKGVNASASSNWQAVMWQIITGNQPMFYLKVAGANYTLVDGLQYLVGAGEHHLRISGDYPLGAYSFGGVITDQIGGTALVDADITFEPLPAITALTLEQSTDQANWSAVAGDLATGYTLPLDLTAAYHYLDVATLTANKTLADGLHPFTLNTTSLPSGFYAYWAAKGVVENATPGAWQAVMWQIITGNQPMFYLKVTGTDDMLVDGLQYLAGAGEQPLRISGDYPLGAYSFDGVITDEIGESSPLTARITFTRLNHAPVAVADSYTTAEDTTLVVAAPGVLANDTDVEGDALSALLVASVAHGTLALNTDGSFTYTPAAGYYGPDSFTYKANDGQVDSNIATVSLTVGPVNDPPVATNDSYDVLEDGTLTQDAPGVLANDSDPENSPLTAVKVTDPQHGSLTLNANGSFTYVPAANFNGSDSFTYKASDGTLQSEAATVSLTVTAVNDAPVLNTIGPKSVDEQMLLTFTATATDVDVPANTLTFDLAAGAPDGATIDPTTGVFTWTPTHSQVGVHSVTVQVSDGSATDSETIQITVYDRTAPDTTIVTTPPNPSGSWAATFTFSSSESGSTFECSLDAGPFAACTSPVNYTNLTEGEHTFQVRATDAAGNTDATPASYTWTIVFPPCGGDPSLVVCYPFDETTGAVVHDGGATPTNDATLTGAAEWVSGQNAGALRFDGATFGAAPDEASLDIAGQITIAAWIRPERYATQDLVKKATNGSVNGYELTLATTKTDESSQRPFFRLNQVENGDTYRINATTMYPIDGTWMHVAGTYDGVTMRLYINGVEESYLPASIPIPTNDVALRIGGEGTATRTYLGALDDVRVYDRALSAEEIAALAAVSNYPPVANADAYNTPQDTPLIVTAPGVLANDTDADDDTLTAIKVTGPAHGTVNLAADGSFTYTPYAGFNGPDSFTYKANDVEKDSNIATVSLTVGQVPTGLTCTDLTSEPLTAGTGEKPQSKVWRYAGAWWAVFPTSASGNTTAGTWLWKLVGTTWTEVLKLSERTDVKADVKVAGDVVHAMLYAGTSTQLASAQYDSGTGAYALWSLRPTASSLSLPNSEIATIDLDTNGRMWLATEDNAADQIVAYYSDAPYGTWNGPITLATGVNDDDIAVVTALPGKIGVLWSNQNTQRFGFRTHLDTQTDPATWTTDEIPASQSALAIGAGMADDHLNVAVTSDGTLYAAVKTGYDATGYPKVALLVRRPAGTWDDLYEVDQAGTRAIVEVDEANGVLNVIYTASEGYNNIVYKQSPLGVISFGSRLTMRTGSYNDASSTKANYTAEFVVIFGSSSEVAGEICVPAGARPKPPAVRIARDVNDVKITWDKVIEDVNNQETTVTKYQVYRSLRPYFEPGDDSSLLPYETVTALEHHDWGAFPELPAYYYVVRAVNAVGPSADSKRVGKFTYTIVPGQN